MKKLIFTLSLLFIFSLTSFAQNDGTISGTVTDQDDEPLAGASVAVYNESTDGDILTGASTDAEGSFSIDIAPGQYVIEITYLSFKPHEQQVQLNAEESLELDTIAMNPAAENLGELFVRAEQSEMQMNFDKRTFSVGQDITSLGGSAVDVLNNVPSVSTDIDGNISLRGNESVRVLINGKPSSMVSGDVDALNSIPATMIKEVEIITNPSSRYAAEGSGGIINIILKKEQRRGVNGNFQVGTGLPEEYEGSANLNYRVGDVNWFFNGGLDYRTDPEGGSSFQRFAGPDTSYLYSEETDELESELDGDIQFGADFYLTDSQVLTASVYASAEREGKDQDITYTDMEYSPGAFSGDIIQEIARDSDEEQDEQNLDFNLDYENKIDGDDHKLVADASFDISQEEATNNIEESVLQGNQDPLMQRAVDEEEEMDLRFNAEYERPLWGDSKLEAGLRSDTEWMDNSYRAETLINGNWISEPAYTDNFRYTENVNAAFAILGYENKAISGQIGLRLENTNIRTEVKSDNTVVTQNYVNLFPSVFLSYSFNEQQSVQASYSRRLRRPWSRSLIPFNDFDDQRSQFTGNPNLTPEFSNSYELGYLHYWKSGSLLTSFYHRYRTDVIDRITEAQQGVTRIFPINLATEKAWGVEFSADQEIADQLNLTANANLFQSNSNGIYQNQVFSSESENFRTRMRLRWEIADGWNYQASMRYRGPSETTQGRREGMTMMDTGLSKDLMDGKAKVTLNIRDLLDSQNFNYTANTDGNPDTDFYTQREFSWSSRSASISFQYFFGERERQQRRGNGPPRR